MSDFTRVARRIDHVVSAAPHTVLGTMRRADHRRSQLARMHTSLRSAVAEQPTPGLLVFVAADGLGQVGRLWLKATDEVRGGVIGRHDMVDLQLAFHDELSLRQALFVVRLHEARVRFSVVDLDTPNGLIAADERPAHLLEGQAPLSFRTGPFSLFCVPTGPGAVLPDDLERAWDCFDAHAAVRPGSWVRRLWPPSRRRPSGMLSVSTPGAFTHYALDMEALERGVLVGRAPRCGVQLAHDHGVSRVHAVLLSVDGVPHVIDAGSTNGLWLLGEEVRCQPLRDQDCLSLGNSSFTWSAAQ